jgi:hypothetical protein
MALLPLNQFELACSWRVDQHESNKGTNYMAHLVVELHTELCQQVKGGWVLIVPVVLSAQLGVVVG